MVKIFDSEDEVKKKRDRTIANSWAASMDL